MALPLCASCKQKVEEGSVRCPSCGTRLDLPGAFTQALGWVILAVSAVFFAISEVTTKERNLGPLIIGVVILVIGIVMLITGRIRSKSVPPTVVPDTNAEAPPNP
jgi:hypothetical protein